MNKLLDNISTNDVKEYFIENYLGFITLRPIDSFNLGRSIVKFDEKYIKKEDGLIEGYPCLKCEYIEYIHLFNKTIKINSVPFMQQNPVIGVCASTSVWVASKILQRRYDLFNIPYYKISQYATQYNLETGSPIYSSGLTINQITTVLKLTNAEIRTIPADMHQEEYIKETLYNYIESNIPVIILIRNINEKVGHSVTALGHFLYKYDSWDNKQKHYTVNHKITIDKFSSIAGRECNNKFYLNSSFINIYYTHDDRYGPFNRIKIFTPDEKNELLKKFKLKDNLKN